MREFRGSVAGVLPRKHINVVLFQEVTAWQGQAVAGHCHACKLLISKAKMGVVADAWQPYINISLGAAAPGGILIMATGFLTKVLGSKNKQPAPSLGEEVKRSTRAAGAVRLYPMPKGEEKVA